MASVRGDFNAATRSSVRPSAHKTAPAIGIDQMTRCTNTSNVEIWDNSFIYSGKKPQRTYAASAKPKPRALSTFVGDCILRAHFVRLCRLRRVFDPPAQYRTPADCGFQVFPANIASTSLWMRSASAGVASRLGAPWISSARSSNCAFRLVARGSSGGALTGWKGPPSDAASR